MSDPTPSQGAPGESSRPADPANAPALPGLGSNPRVSYDPARSIVTLAEGLAAAVPIVSGETGEFGPTSTEGLHGAGGHVSIVPWHPPFGIGEGGIGADPPAETTTYLLHRPIGRGGFGEVWEATQWSLNRLVAIKRLRPDHIQRNPLAIDFMRRSFRQEALTAASLEHPNVVAIHDLGTDPTGDPLLVMTLVRGVPWDRLIASDWQQMSVTDFLGKHLEILSDVCNAVAFAHSRGIVHRDIKPSQVMVGEYGEVKLMDWGLAVCFDGQLASRGDGDIPALRAPDLASATSPAGTPSFMAPEQTRATAHGIGTWTDVYLLGGTLYYLLTGTAPHDAADARVSILKAGASLPPDPPQQRAPAREVPAELADIAMRALAPEPGDRFASARAFQDALRDYFTGAGKRREAEALLARVRERLHDDAPTYSRLAEALTWCGTAKGLWSESPEVDILRESVLAQYAGVALANRDLMLARLQVTQMAPGRTQDALLDRLGKAESARHRRDRQRRTAIAAAAILALLLAGGSLKYLADQRAANERLEAQVARALAARGDAESLIGYMINDLRERLDPLDKVALLDDAARQSIAYYDRLPADDRTPQTTSRQLAVLTNASSIRLVGGDMKGAEEAAQRALALLSDPSLLRAGDGRYQQGNTYLQLAVLARERGDSEKALEWFRKAGEVFGALQPGETTPKSRILVNRIIAHSRVGMLLQTRGDATGAAAEFEKMRECAEEALADPTGAPRDLANVKRMFSVYLALKASQSSAAGDLPSARDALIRSRDLLSGIASDGDDPGIRRDLAIARRSLSLVFGQMGETSAAFDELVAARDMMRGLMLGDLNNADYLRNYGVLCGDVANTLTERGDHEGALRENLEFERSFERLAERAPTNVSVRFNRAMARSAVAGSLDARGDLGGAHARLVTAESELAALHAEDPTNNTWTRELALSWRRIGLILERAARRAEAIERQQEAAALLAQLCERVPTNFSYRREAGSTQQVIARLLWLDGDTPGALAALAAAQKQYAAVDATRALQVLESSYEPLLHAAVIHATQGAQAEARAALADARDRVARFRPEARRARAIAEAQLAATAALLELASGAPVTDVAAAIDATSDKDLAEDRDVRESRVLLLLASGRSDDARALATELLAEPVAPSILLIEATRRLGIAIPPRSLDPRD